MWISASALVPLPNMDVNARMEHVALGAHGTERNLVCLVDILPEGRGRQVERGHELGDGLERVDVLACVVLESQAHVDDYRAVDLRSAWLARA